MHIRITVNGKDLSEERIKQWEQERAGVVYKFLRSKLSPDELQQFADAGASVAEGGTRRDSKLAWVHAVQRHLAPERARSLSLKEASRSAALSKLLNFFSRSRKHCIVEMHVEGLDAHQFVAFTDSKMLSSKSEDWAFCMNA
jgi:hypothetical protein